MPLVIDPAGKEVCALAAVMDWHGKHALEIVSGDGRLTLRLARLGARLYAIDPDPKQVRLARNKLPKRFASQIEYHRGDSLLLKQRDWVFDLVVFAWAL